MTATAFFGYLFLSCGSPLAVWLVFIYPSSFLILSALTSTFIWLFIMLVTSAIFRGFVPLDDSAGAYAGMLLAAVAIEEVGRYGAFWAQCKAASALTTIANRAGVIFNTTDDTLLALSVGWGHGFTHMLFQFLPFLPMTWSRATVYNDRCPNMSVFLVSCLTQLAMFGILTGLHVMYVVGMRRKRYALAAIAPAAHLGAALITLANFADNACYATVPILLCGALAAGGAAGWIAWHTAMRPQPVAQSSRLVPAE